MRGIRPEEEMVGEGGAGGSSLQVNLGECARLILIFSCSFTCAWTLYLLSGLAPCMRANIRTALLMPLLTLQPAIWTIWHGVVCGCTRPPWMTNISWWCIRISFDALQHAPCFLRIAHEIYYFQYHRKSLKVLYEGVALRAIIERILKVHEKYSNNVCRNSERRLLAAESACILLELTFCKAAFRVSCSNSTLHPHHCDFKHLWASCRLLRSMLTVIRWRKEGVATKHIIGTPVLGALMSCWRKSRALHRCILLR